MTHPQQTTREVLEQLVYALDELHKNPALKYENTFIESALAAGREALAHPPPSTAGERALIDRSDAVNLARNISQHDSDDITQAGVRILCDAVLRMDAALLQSTALPVGELTEMHLLDTPEPDKYVDCGEGRPLPMFHLSTLLQYGARLAAARSQPVLEPLQYCSECMRPKQSDGTCSHGITKKGAP